MMSHLTYGRQVVYTRRPIHQTPPGLPMAWRALEGNHVLSRTLAQNKLSPGPSAHLLPTIMVVCSSTGGRVICFTANRVLLPLLPALGRKKSM